MEKANSIKLKLYKTPNNNNGKIIFESELSVINNSKLNKTLLIKNPTTEQVVFAINWIKLLIMDPDNKLKQYNTVGDYLAEYVYNEEVFHIHPINISADEIIFKICNI